MATTNIADRIVNTTQAAFAAIGDGHGLAEGAVGMGAGAGVVHCWELGGGRPLARLLKAVVTPRALPRLLVTIVLDLSNPFQAIQSLGAWISTVRKVVAQVTDRMGAE